MRSRSLLKSVSEVLSVQNSSSVIAAKGALAFVRVIQLIVVLGGGSSVGLDSLATFMCHIFSSIITIGDIRMFKELLRFDSYLSIAVSREIALRILVEA